MKPENQNNISNLVKGEIPDKFLDIDRILLMRTEIDLSKGKHKMAIGHLRTYLMENSDNQRIQNALDYIENKKYDSARDLVIQELKQNYNYQK